MGAELTGDEISVQITNDIVPRTVIVWMVPEKGGRRRLGSIPPNATRSFTYAQGTAGAVVMKR